MSKNSNNESANQQEGADSSIGNSQKNGKSENAITLHQTRIENNRHPAISQLKALNYKDGDIVTGRNISVANDKNKDWRGKLTEDNIIIQEGSWKAGSFAYDGNTHKDGLGWLDEQNYNTGIYFNVNGGRDNSAVKRFRAAFFESDKGTHDEQQLIIDKFGLPVTVQVRTKRSNHCYYTIYCPNPEDYGNLEHWTKLQEKNAYVMGSDPAVKDKPRLMRLAGFSHVSIAKFAYDGGEFDYIDCELIECNISRQYTLEQIHNALDEYCTNQGIKPYSESRFRLYQYIISKLNQKKKGVNYKHQKFDPNIARNCEDSELEEYTIRVKNWARLCERRHRGLECAAPETAWADPLEKVKKTYEADFKFKTIDKTDAQLRQGGLISGETLPHYFARNYGKGFSSIGENKSRQHWATCQCPHHGSSTGSIDNLHINVSDPNYPLGTISCKSGCDAKDVMLAFRQLAQDAGDPLWDASYGKKQKTQEEWKEQRDKELKNKWQKAKTLTPTITNQTPYFQYGMRALPVQLSLLEDPPPQQYITAIPEENLMLLGCGDLGGGKTTWMKSIIELIRETRPTERWFAFGYINGLLLQQCGAWKKNQIGSRRFKHLQSDKAFNDIHKEGQDLALCVHSLKHFEDCLSVFDGCNIVIDEIVSVIKALLQDDNIKECDRNSILYIFSEALRRAKRVFCFDALLSDLTVWYLSEVCPQKKVISVKNEYQRPKPKIELLLGTAELEKQLASVEKIKKSDNSPICKALLNSKRFVLVSDNRTIIQILGELLKEQGKEVLVICRDTNGQKDVKDFLECPNNWIQENWINKNIDGCVLISPTGGSGIDISVRGYFTDLYGLFFGVIDVDAILQMLGRLRDNEAKFHVWVKDQGSIQNLLGNFSKEIRRNVRAYIDHLRTIIWEGYNGDPALDIITKFSNDLLEKANDIHFKAQCALMSQQLYEEWHLRECLQETLISRGYELEYVTLESAEGSKKLIKDKREVYYKHRSESIFNAADLTEEEVTEISSNFFQTPEQKDALQKFSLRSRLPGIELTELWNADFIQSVIFTSPLYLYQLETLYLLRNPEVAKLKAQTRWAAALERESLRHFDMLNERYARVKALQNINIEYFLDPNNSWDNSSPELIAAAKEAKKPHNKVALPKAPDKDLVKWINNVLESLTYDPKLSRVDSEQRRYKIALDEEAEKKKTILLECLGKQEKYVDLNKKQKSHILSSKIPQKPCTELLRGDSTCGEFCLDKTSGKWSLANPEKNTPSSKHTHVEELFNGLGHRARDTDIWATG